MYSIATFSCGLHLNTQPLDYERDNSLFFFPFLFFITFLFLFSFFFFCFNFFFFFFFFFASLVFSHEHSRFKGQQGKGDAISLTPLYHFYPLHRHLDINHAITAHLCTYLAPGLEQGTLSFLVQVSLSFTDPLSPVLQYFTITSHHYMERLIQATIPQVLKNT